MRDDPLVSRTPVRDSATLACATRPGRGSDRTVRRAAAPPAGRARRPARRSGDSPPPTGRSPPSGAARRRARARPPGDAARARRISLLPSGSPHYSPSCRGLENLSAWSLLIFEGSARLPISQAVPARRHHHAQVGRAVIAEPADQAGHRRNRGSRCGRPVGYNIEDYKNRNVVERFFNRKESWRGSASRFDKHAVVYRGGVVLAAILDCLR